MFKDAKIIRLTPDAPGKGGQKTAFHTHPTQPIIETRTVYNCHVYQGRWRKDFRATLPGGRYAATGAYVAATNDDTAGSLVSKSLHAYYKAAVNASGVITDPGAAPRTWLLSHGTVGSGIPTNRYWNHSKGSLITLPDTTTTHSGYSVPATFLNIGTRCFVADGAREGLILAGDAQQTAFGVFVAGSNIVYGDSFSSLWVGRVITGVTGAPYTITAATQYQLQLGANFTGVNGAYVFTMSWGAELNTYDLGITQPGIAPRYVIRSSESDYINLLEPTYLSSPDVAGQLAGVIIGDSLTIDPDSVDPTIPLVYTNPVAATAGAVTGPFALPGFTIAATAGDNFVTITPQIAPIGGHNFIGNKITFNGEEHTIIGVTPTGATTVYYITDTVANTYPIGTAIGTIQCIAVVAIADGETFTINDNINPPTVFEFGTNGAWTPGNIPIDIAAGFGTIETATFVNVAINGVGAALQVSSTADLFLGLVHLTHDVPLTNLTVTNTVANPAWTEVVTNPGVTGAFVITGTYVTVAPAPAAAPLPALQDEVGKRRTVHFGFAADGLLSWTDVGPSHAYAWYDPIAGHVSNVSPVLTITEKNQTNVRVLIPLNGAAAIEFPSAVDRKRFTHILFFRTLLGGGSSLYPIGSLDPSNVPGPAYGISPYSANLWRGISSTPPAGAPPIIYWEDNYPDAELLVSGALRAPLFTNSKPLVTIKGSTTPVFPAHWAAWDGRLWLSPTQDPGAIYYSGDRAQVPFGVPEESFPADNILRIPAVDNKITGIRLVGSVMVVTTDRWAYYVAGNVSTNYRLLRLSTSMYGVSEQQMAEFVGETEQDASAMVYFGRDQRIYVMTPGQGSFPLSSAIQDQISLVNTKAVYDSARIHVTAANGRRVAVVRCNTGGGTELQYLYDFQQKVWTQNDTNLTATDNFARGQAYASVYGGDPPIDELFIYGGKVRSWLYEAATTQNGAQIILFPTDFDSQKTDKQLNFVRIYTSANPQPTSNPFFLRVYPDEARWLQAFFVPYGTTVNTDGKAADQVYTIYPAGAQFKVDGVNAAELVAFPFGASNLVSGVAIKSPLIARRFVIEIGFPTSNTSGYPAQAGLFTNASATVTGTGFLVSWVGKILVRGSEIFTVSTVAGDGLSLTLSAVFAGGTNTYSFVLLEQTPLSIYAIDICYSDIAKQGDAPP